MTTTRRLAAILAADVAGYSRLIGADEEGTLNRLRSIPAEVIGRRQVAKAVGSSSHLTHVYDAYNRGVFEDLEMRAKSASR